MARQNMAYLFGRVHKDPVIAYDNETGEYKYAACYIDVVRPPRDVGDDIKFIKHDKPMIMTKDKEIIDQIVNWKENMVVLVKGPLTTAQGTKTSYCPFCEEKDGEKHKVVNKGNIVYVTPIHVEVVKEFDNKLEATEYIVENKEVSNQILVVGTVLNDPKLITTKKGIQFCQYRLAINRKYTIRTDDPSVRTDWPIVKSYGEQARDDKIYLKYQADVLIDGFLQARTVTRKQKCPYCGEIYEWKDHTMELVPFAVEYLNGFKSKEEVEAEAQKPVEDIKQMLFTSGYKDEINETTESDLKSDDIDS
ncbi:MAG: single-stranded DNA-binding protein [Lachnospiraceae bacterium]|nr:single-stranded DNA-binding protein [Lachnospiraceae bacterium]